MDTMEQRVAKGVALLDEKMPKWRDFVDLELLDMSEAAYCVLGQACGYTYGCEVLGIYGRGYEGGFDLTFEEYTDEYSGRLLMDLHDLWVKAIENKSD